MTFIGNTWRLKGVFTDAEGKAVDPTKVKCVIQIPGKAIETFEYGVSGSGVERENIGVYFRDVTPGVPGTVRFAWIGEGEHAAADEQAFVVERGMLLGSLLA